MIIWLSSYPKSGNTWVRLFLDNLLSPDKEFNINHNLIGQFPLRNHFLNLSDNINDQDEFAKNCVKAQQKLNLDNSLKIFKTHNAFWNWGGGEHTFTNEENTLGVIYIVRDPRNIITSVLNYFHKKNYYEALKFMKENKVLGGDEAEIGLPTIIGSWSNHYKSWKNNSIFKVLFIKYEDLEKYKEETFKEVILFVNQFKKNEISLNEKKFLNSIRSTNFNNLKNKELNEGFEESVYYKKTKKKVNFFNLGFNNRWKKILSPDMIEIINKKFEKEIKELGY